MGAGGDTTSKRREIEDNSQVPLEKLERQHLLKWGERLVKKRGTGLRKNQKAPLRKNFEMPVRHINEDHLLVSVEHREVD